MIRRAGVIASFRILLQIAREWGRGGPRLVLFHGPAQAGRQEGGQQDLGRVSREEGQNAQGKAG